MSLHSSDSLIKFVLCLVLSSPLVVLAPAEHLVRASALAEHTTHPEVLLIREPWNGLDSKAH